VKKICVFCGASNNVPDHFIKEARAFGKALAENGFEVVYGGSKYGSMGALADGALEAGGIVTGVFPEQISLINENVHEGVSNIMMVPNMHTRKLTMYNLSDAFIILPGGFGTMDETFEILTWKSLGTHDTPVIFYNYRDYFKHWVQLVQHFIDTGFASQEIENYYQISNSKKEILDMLKNVAKVKETVKS
jgi:uncharacterized protein (TIGR00730 family)